MVTAATTPIWEISLTDDFNMARITDTLIKFTGNLINDLAACCRALDIMLHPSFKITDQSKIFSSTGIRFDNASFKVLCLVLSHCPSIVGLKFCNSGLSNDQLDMLERVCTKDNMTFLQLDWNTGADPEKYIRFVGPESKLQTLILRRCDINDAVFAGMCQELKINTVLLALDLYGNRLTSLTPFADLMLSNRILKAISFASCGLSDDELGCLVDVLGRVPFPPEHVEAHRKLEKDRDMIITKNSKLKGKKQPDPVPIVDPIEQDPETSEWFLLKAQSLEVLNVSLNSFNNFSNLQTLLSQANHVFKLCVMGPADLAYGDRKKLKSAFGEHLVA